MLNKFVMALILLVPVLGHAEQRLMIKEGGNVTANIAASALNRIAIEGDRILTVKGNVGQFQLEKDLTLGQIYIQPSMPEDKNPIPLYLTTEKGKTYSLTLLSTDMPADNIILVSNHTQAELIAWEQSAPYEELIVKIIKAMHNQSDLEGYISTNTDKKQIKIKNLLVTSQGHYVGSKLQGYCYEVQNHSEQAIYLSESHFYKKGIRAISILNKSLAPQAKTLLYIVSEV